MEDSYLNYTKNNVYCTYNNYILLIWLWNFGKWGEDSFSNSDLFGLLKSTHHLTTCDQQMMVLFTGFYCQLYFDFWKSRDSMDLEMEFLETLLLKTIKENIINKFTKVLRQQRQGG